MRAMIISQPKAGTYLCAEILKQVGMKPTNWHLFRNRYTDYSGVGLEDARAKPGGLTKRRKLCEAAAEIDQAHFAVGHIGYAKSVAETLEPFRKILLTRELRQALESLCRFKYATGRFRKNASWHTFNAPRLRLARFLRESGPEYLAKFYGPVAMWHGQPGTLTIPYTALRSPETVQEIADHIERPIGHDGAEAALQAALEADTITKMPKSTGSMWTPDCEQWFRTTDGPRINQSLGYFAGRPAYISES